MNIEIPKQFDNLIAAYAKEKGIDEKNIGQFIGYLFYRVVTCEHETEFSLPNGKSIGADMSAVEDFFNDIAEELSTYQEKEK